MQREFGDEAAAGLRGSFTLGDPEQLLALFTGVRLADVKLDTVAGRACFPSVHAMVRAEVDGWGLGEKIDEAKVARLLRQAEHVLQPFVGRDSALAFPIRAHIVSARRTRGPPADRVVQTERETWGNGMRAGVGDGSELDAQGNRAK